MKKTILLALMVLACASGALGQIDCIRWQASDGSAIGNYCSPFAVKAGTGITFSKSGQTMTISAPAADSTGAAVNDTLAFDGSKFKPSVNGAATSRTDSTASPSALSCSNSTGDRNKVVALTFSGAIALGGFTPGAGCPDGAEVFIDVQASAGVVTLTPGSGNCNGSATCTLVQGFWRVRSDGSQTFVNVEFRGKITEAQQLLSDVTTANVSTSAHGYAPKGDGSAAHYLDGTGAYSTPGGSAVLANRGIWLIGYPQASPAGSAFGQGNANRLHAVHITVSTGKNGITKMSASLNTASAGADTCDIGIYSDDGQTRLAHFAITCATGTALGAQTGTVSSFNLPAGDYWIATCQSSTDAKYDSPFLGSALMGNLVNSQTQKEAGVISSACTSGALPTTFTPSSLTAASGAPPMVYLQ